MGEKRTAGAMKMAKIKCNKCGTELEWFVEYGIAHGHYRVIYNQKTGKYNHDGGIDIDGYEVNGYYCPQCEAELDAKIARFGVSGKT